MPSGHAPEPNRDGSENFAFLHFAIFADAQAGNAPSRCFDHVQEFLARVEADLIGELETFSHHFHPAILVPRQIAIGEIGAQRLPPILEARGYGKPNAIFRIAKHEINFADGLAIDLVGQHARGAARAS